MKKHIKILYCYSSAKLDTGSPRALLQMVDSLDRSRFSLAFFTIGEGGLTKAMRDRDVEVFTGTVDTIALTSPFRSISSIRSKLRLLKYIGADILHMNEPGWNSDIVFAARLAKIPVVIHLHNPYAISLSNLNMRFARRVFLCSAAQGKTIESYDRIRGKAVVLHNSVDIAAFAQGKPIRESIGVNDDELVIGTVAQISHRKGIDTFLDAAESLLTHNNKLKFVIVGPQVAKESEYFSRIMERLQLHPLKSNVIYLGSRQDIPDLLASFDVFCLATRAEPFGMVVIEAMAAGVPVVASEIGGIPEIISDRSIGRLVKPLTSDAFATNLNELIKMGEERKALGQRGRKSVKERFDLSRMGDTLTNVYLDLAS